MEFSCSSDDEINVEYEKYQHTPYTDPSVVKKLWWQHFSRNPKERNREVTRAFEMKCSLYQFMYPELYCEEVRIKALNDIGIRASSTADKETEKHSENTSNLSQEEEGQSCLESSPTNFNKLNKSMKVDPNEFQVKSKISELSKQSTNGQNPLQKAMKTNKMKTHKKKINLEKVQINMRKVQMVSPIKHCYTSMFTEQPCVKIISRSTMESPCSSIISSGIVTTENTKTCINDFSNDTVPKKHLYIKKDEKYLNIESSKNNDTLNKKSHTLQEKNTCVKIKPMNSNDNDVNGLKSTKKRKSKGQENINLINTSKTKVPKKMSAKPIVKQNILKKLKSLNDPLPNITYLVVLDLEKVASNNVTIDFENSKKQEGS